jgi:hypothetical protein
MEARPLTENCFVVEFEPEKLLGSSPIEDLGTTGVMP